MTWQHHIQSNKELSLSRRVQIIGFVLYYAWETLLFNRVIDCDDFNCNRLKMNWTWLPSHECCHRCCSVFCSTFSRGLGNFLTVWNKCLFSLSMALRQTLSEFFTSVRPNVRLNKCSYLKHDKASFFLVTTTSQQHLYLPQIKIRVKEVNLYAS